jgi:hypothetical protein
MTQRIMEEALGKRKSTLIGTGKNGQVKALTLNTPKDVRKIKNKGREYYLQHVEKLKSNNSVRRTSE